jgi:hypothetical protein
MVTQVPTNIQSDIESNIFFARWDELASGGVLPVISVPRHARLWRRYAAASCQGSHAILIEKPSADFDGSVTGVGREQDRTSKYPEARKALRNRY